MKKLNLFYFPILPSHLLAKALPPANIVQYLAITLNKTCTSHKDDHHNCHLSLNIYQIYLLAQTNPITSIISLCLTIPPFLSAAPAYYPTTCYSPFNTYYLLLLLLIPTAPAYHLITCYLLLITCSCSWLLLLITLPLTTRCVVLCTVWCAVWCGAVWCFLTPRN